MLGKRAAVTRPLGKDRSQPAMKSPCTNPPVILAISYQGWGCTGQGEASGYLSTLRQGPTSRQNQMHHKSLSPFVGVPRSKWGNPSASILFPPSVGVAQGKCMRHRALSYSQRRWTAVVPTRAWSPAPVDSGLPSSRYRMLNRSQRRWTAVAPTPAVSPASMDCGPRSSMIFAERGSMRSQ